MKSQAKLILQRSLGFHRYLVLHSIFVALTMRFRRNEGAVLKFISRLPPDANVLDVGANVGTMTLLFARRCRQGRIFAFEPIPENCRAARTVLSLFRTANVQLFQLGAGEREESVTMIMPEAGPDVRLEGLCHVVDSAREEAELGTLYEVRLIALDEFAELRGIRITAIKIDVEDHERFVLRGGRNLIARDRPLIYCELWGAQNKTECFTMLTELDYQPYIATSDGLQAYDAEAHRDVNFFFVPRERHAQYVLEAA